ncbi:kinase-like domain-containing protein, partial [Mucidula mucida]
LYLEELIGSGGFGAVYRGWDITSSSHYAVKVMLTPAFGSSEEKLLSAEIELHERVTKHKNIVTFHKCIVDGPFTFILLDLCSGDDLYSRIQQHQYKFNDELIRSTMIQVIDALQYCHDKDVYHRDLKPENILTSSDGHSVFLADFGLSTSDDVSDQLRVGTLEYMSPECVRLDSYSPFYLPRYNDIWSMGIILINLVTDSYPWDSAQSTDPLFEEYLNNPDFITENTPKKCHQSAVNWSRHPQTRPVPTSIACSDAFRHREHGHVFRGARGRTQQLVMGCSNLLLSQS